ncbi:MAG: ABC transporter substrate-binding protein, partial [Chloroflexia bacterium]
QAIATAINRQQIVEKVALGKYPVLHTFIPPSSWASMQNHTFARDWDSRFPLKKYAYDPTKANEMLDAAGWVRGPDGTREKNGVRLSFEYATTSGKVHELTTQLVRTDLLQVGIDARVRYVPSALFFAPAGYLAQRQFDLAEFSRTLDATPGGSVYDSASIPSTANNLAGANYSGYSNPHFDLLSRAAAGEPARTTRAPLLAEMQQIFAEDLPALPLYTRAKIEVHKASLVNWETSGGDTPATYKVAALYFKP